jgi:uncharacterized protein (DUF1778 family)
MKFTESKDGKLRTTLRASIRLEKDEVAALKAAAKREGQSLTEYLSQALLCGVREQEHLTGRADET